MTSHSKLIIQRIKLATQRTEHAEDLGRLMAKSFDPDMCMATPPYDLLRTKAVPVQLLEMLDTSRIAFKTAFLDECYTRVKNVDSELAAYWKITELAQENCGGCADPSKPHLHLEVCFNYWNEEKRHSSLSQRRHLGMHDARACDDQEVRQPGNQENQTNDST